MVSCHYRPAREMPFKCRCPGGRCASLLDVNGDEPLPTEVSDHLSNKQITKAWVRLHGCTGWSAPGFARVLLYDYPKERIMLALISLRWLIRDFVFQCRPNSVFSKQSGQFACTPIEISNHPAYHRSLITCTCMNCFNNST